jgi:phosphatidylglycerol:prolipoprotein diacylglycerol transferase
LFPKLIEIGSLYLPTYGVLVALGFLAGLAITVRLAKGRGLDTEKVNKLAVYCALAGLLGAKLMMIAFDWKLYSERPGEIFTIETLQAAGVYQGGFLLAFLAAILLIRNYRLPALTTMDAFAPGIAIGHAIGRIGCFAAGCCWGAACDRPWAVEFTNVDAARLTGVPLGQPLHPSQLYESAAELLIFFGLWRLFARNPRPGTVFGLYLVLYSTVRFFVEFVRFHAQELPFGGPLSNTQWISIAMALGGVLILMRPAVSHPRPAVS